MSYQRNGGCRGVVMFLHKETSVVLSDRDAEKMVKIAKVRHVKFGAQTGDNIP